MILTREKIAEEDQISRRAHTCSFPICSSDNHCNNCQCNLDFGTFHRRLFCQRLLALSHNHQKHQAKISLGESGRAPRHLFRPHAQTNTRRHGKVPVVLQDKTKENGGQHKKSQEETLTDGASPIKNAKSKCDLCCPHKGARIPLREALWIAGY